VYKGIQDYLATGLDAAGENRVIVPSSHISSERAMRAAFMDTMAVTGRFKKPHLFITMTSNPNWAEIHRAGIDEPRRFGDPRLQAEEAADARRDLQGPDLR
jgi:helitron helicase-like protein